MRRISPYLVTLLGLALIYWTGYMRPVSTAKSGTPMEGVVQTRIADEIPEQNKVYDPDNPDYQKLQKANESLIRFPLEKKGYVNWIGALRSGFINPMPT